MRPTPSVHRLYRPLPAILPVVALILSLSIPVSAETTPGDCLSSEEALLAELINDYRISEGLDPIPVSTSLTAVGQWHVWDLDLNHPNQGECNLHSWSDAGTWSPVCYTPDHAQASGMWFKPREITGNIYTGYGFEIAYASGGTATAQNALNGWKSSTPHEDVMLNRGTWATYDPWPAMGIGIREGYAVVWFGGNADPQGSVEPCTAATTTPRATRMNSGASIASIHPNPFNPRTSIRLDLGTAGHVSLTVYDSRGRKLVQLLDGYHDAGVSEIVWDGTTSDGTTLASGVYYLKLTHPNGADLRRVALIE